MSILLGSSRTFGCSRRNQGILCVVTQVRNGGGGGRPGGLPVFNWKEKKFLRLSIKKEKKETKIAESGNWADIAHLFDEKKGDVKVNWDVEKNFVIDAVDESSQQINSRKQVSMSLLFGPEKSFGLLPKKENVDKLKFSHSRIFGHTRKSLYNPTGVLN